MDIIQQYLCSFASTYTYTMGFFNWLTRCGALVYRTMFDVLYID